jgi:hypothetical protein
MGRTTRLDPTDGACSSSSGLLGPTCAQRGGGQGEGVAGVGGVHVRGEANGSRVRMQGKVRQTWYGRAHAAAICAQRQVRAS